MTSITEYAGKSLAPRSVFEVYKESLLKVLTSDRSLSLVIPAVLIVLWFAAVRHQWLPEQILPAPSLMLATATDVISTGELLFHTWISVQRVILGFLLGAFVGLAFGVFIGLSKLAEEYLYPTFKLFVQVPSLAWLPMLMMLVGLEEALKIILIAKSAFVPVAMNAFNGLRGVSNRYIEVAKVFNFNRYQLLRFVVFPSAFPPIWNGIRFGLTHAWLALVGVELLASTEGLGYLIVWGRQLFQMDLVFVAVIVVGLIGYLLDKFLNGIERRVLHWRRDSF